MRKILIPYVIIPAAVCGLVTFLRVWLELHSPDHALTRWASANVLSMVWMFCLPPLMLRSGLSLGQGLVTAFLFFLLFRLPIGVIYAAAWAGKWTVEGTDEPVRYVTDITDPETSTMTVFLFNTFAPILFSIVFVFILWSITYAIAFRGKRPFARAAQ